MTVFQDAPARQFGFLRDATQEGAEPDHHPKQLYDVVQFFDPNNTSIFNTDAGASSGSRLMTGMGVGLTINDTIGLAAVSGGTNCEIQFIGLETSSVQDNLMQASIRGFVFGSSTLEPPTAPSVIPSPPGA